MYVANFAEKYFSLFGQNERKYCSENDLKNRKYIVRKYLQSMISHETKEYEV